MTENNQPEQNPLDLGKASEVPAGYDQPAAPAYGAPSHQQAAAPAAPSYQQPAAPAYQQPVAPAEQNYQQSYQQQQNMQQGGFQQSSYPMAGGEQKSKVVAGILGILLGSLGIHNFYLGKTKIALIQLLVSVVSFGFLAPIMGIWGLVEGILILVGHENYRTDSRGIPLKD